MDIQDLRTLVDFHYWARDRVLDAVAALTPEQYTRDLGSSFKSVHDTLRHLYLAEWIWYSRWQGESPTAWPPTDAAGDLTALRAAWARQEAELRAFVNRLGADGVHRMFEYRLMNGQPGRSPFAEMLQHLVNHGTYHRGQIATLLRQLGKTPASTDYLRYIDARGA